MEIVRVIYLDVNLTLSFPDMMKDSRATIPASKEIKEREKLRTC